MTVLSPSGLETCTIGTSGWNAIYSANFEKINTHLGHPLSAFQNSGVPVVSDPAAQTSETLTNSTGGVISNTIGAVSGSGADTQINDNFASQTDEINKLRADVLELRSKIVTLLAALRKTTGIGSLAN